MVTENKLDKSFGPVGSSSGVFIFIIGLIIVFYSFFGLILILFGGFVGFSTTSTLINNDERRVKFSNNLFGILRIGQWLNIEPTMKLGIEKSNKAWRTYSRSNRTLDMTIKDFRIILYDSSNNPIMPLKKTDTLDSAKVELEILGNKLGLRKDE